MSITTKANTESIFKWVENRYGGYDLSVEDAVILYKNLEGHKDRFNPNGGKRTFVLVLSTEAGEELKSLGWNIKKKDPRDENDEYPLYTTEIVVNMNSKFPPSINICAEKDGRNIMYCLEESELKNIDVGDFSRIDLIIHPYEHDKDARFKYKGYCKALYATEAKNAYFDGKYDSFERVNDSVETDHPTDEDDEELPF